MRLAVVVKYFPPLERVSGIVGFLTVLCREAARHADITVVTHRPRGDQLREVERDGYRIVRVGGSFPVAAGSWVRRAKPDAVLFVSGIHETRLAAPYIAGFLLASGASSRCHILQATHLDGPPSRAMGLVFGRARGVVAASVEIADVFDDRFGWTVPVVEPAVDLVTLPVRDASRPTIGFVNHFNEVKGADRAVDIVEELLDRHEHLRAIFAGTGDLAGLVEQRLGAHPRVSVLGFLDDATRLATIAACDIMLLPFRTAVSVLGVSQTVLEVMATGGVVAGTPTAAITPAIVHRRNGVLAEADELAWAVEELIVDPDRRSELGAAARADAVARWAIGGRVTEVLELLGSD